MIRGGFGVLYHKSEIDIACLRASLAHRAKAVFNKACHRCHGKDGASEGGFNFATNLEKLASIFAIPGEDSLILERVLADDDSIMPPVGEEPALTESDLRVIKEWVDAGSPAIKSVSQREHISNDAVVSAILADLQRTRDRSQRFKRYFTLSHLYNAGVSDDELQTYRNAFVKLINSLSWNTDLIIPTPLDEAETIYGIDIRKLHWDNSIWNSVEQANPYFLNSETEDALACAEKTQTKMPYVRIDWFVFAASKPPLYHSVLNLPETDAALENMLRVNVNANIEQETAIRAGFNRSGVSQNNRLIEWHKSPYGSYWKSYDFGGNTGQQNLFDYPMGPNGSSNSFRQDGGEIIFTLPNGLQGYLLVDEFGKRIDQGPTNIVSDPKQLDRTVTNGVSCMSCHYSGVIPKKDEVGVAVRANRDAFEAADNILALYRKSSVLDAVLDEDGQRFSAVMAELGITNISRSGESISAMAGRFQQDVDLNHVAAEFGLQTKEFLKRLDGTSRVARIFSALRIKGGTIKRDVFKETFGDAAVELRIASSHSNAGRAKRSPTQMPRSKPRRGSQSTTSSSAYGAIKKVAEFNDLGWGFNSVAVDPESRFLVGGHSGDLTVMDIKNQSTVAKVEDMKILNRISAVRYSDNGAQLFVGGTSGQVLIFNVNRRGQLKPAGQFSGHSNDVTRIAVSADGKFALTGGDGKKVRYWNVASGKEITQLAGFEGKVKAVNISPDGKRIQATDGAVFLEYDLDKEEIIQQRPLTRSWAAGQAATISKDGSLVAAGDSYDIIVWETTTGKKIATLEDQEIQWSMTFSPDNKRLLSGGSGKINIWDFAVNQRTHAQPTGGSYVKGIAMSADGKTFANTANTRQSMFVFRFQN